jgi:hypothetical protein
MRTAQFIFGAE